MSGAIMYFSVGQRNGDDSGEHSDASAQQALDGLRAELDAVDATLLDAVRQRLEVCLRIGELKRREHIAMMQPGRIHIVHERARQYADSHSLSPEFFDSLYDLLIAETCRLEDLVINAEPADEGLYHNGHHDHRDNHHVRHSSVPSANVES
ncbi:chorismate mutase family protein [Rhodococcus sp. IEGM 1307]|nr:MULTISPECIES: chorismate mutase family protein [unclassified Rhodococcus (in: high G+C Gram-positive bacteria)]MDI9952716.1 chorismate mutase family protein [Rhodococcus sp. IEGM 1305]MDI9975406.1 chorismate mutase family protein [Rhodococcus sp. IEGM 1307]